MIRNSAELRTVGVVLAGGRSTRFGSEKAVAVVDGAPMVARVAAVLANGCDAVAVNAPESSGAADWARANGLEVLPDLLGLPDGPLTGVLAGLRWARTQGAEALVTSPCDTPWLPTNLVAWLLDGLGDAPAVFAQTSQGPHPLCAVWRTEVEPALTALLGGLHPSVRSCLADLKAATVRFDSPAAFANLNRPPAPSPGRIVAAFAAAALAGLAYAVLYFVLMLSIDAPARGLDPKLFGAILPSAWIVPAALAFAWVMRRAPPWRRGVTGGGLIGPWAAPAAVVVFALVGWPLVLTLALGGASDLLGISRADPLFVGAYFTAWPLGTVCGLAAAVILARRRNRLTRRAARRI